jgi:hypothetical protein
MEWKNEISETRIAQLVRTGRNLVEIRFKPGSTMDMAGVREVYEARVKMFGDQPHASIVIIPDDVDIELGITKVDHYSATRSSDPLVAMAVVAEAAMIDMVAKLYFSYFPQSFPVLTTSDAAEARSWAEAQLEKKSKQAG